MSKFWKELPFWFNILAFVTIIAANYGYKGELPEGWAIFVPPALAVINEVLLWVKRWNAQR